MDAVPEEKNGLYDELTFEDGFDGEYVRFEAKFTGGELVPISRTTVDE